MRAARVLVAALAAACATAQRTDAVDAARTLDDDAVLAQAAEIDGPHHAKDYVVVANGEVAAFSPRQDEALRLSETKAPAPRHRYLFRPSERGLRLYRTAFVAGGGIVAGGRFLTGLGISSIPGRGGRAPHLLGKGGVGRLELTAAPNLRIELVTLDGAARRTVDATYDPDFDGGLLLPRDVAASLTLERFEVPGGADVQVAMGRPFRALRATVVANIPSLHASGPVEALYETATPGR